MSKLTYEVKRDPTTTRTVWMYVIKRDGKPIAAQGGFTDQKTAAMEAKKLV